MGLASDCYHVRTDHIITSLVPRQPLLISQRRIYRIPTRCQSCGSEMLRCRPGCAAAQPWSSAKGKGMGTTDKPHSRHWFLHGGSWLLFQVRSQSWEGGLSTTTGQGTLCGHLPSKPGLPLQKHFSWHCRPIKLKVIELP